MTEHEHEYDVSGAITFYKCQPTPYEVFRQAMDVVGYGHCVPNPRTDQSALTNAVKEVHGGRNKKIIGRKQPKKNGVELVDIERDTVHNGYTTSFGAKVVQGRVVTDYGYADQYRLTEEFLKSKAVLTSGAVGATLAAILDKMDCVHGFDDPRVRYVPEHWLGAWRQIGDVLTECSPGSRITIVRAAMDAHACAMIRDILTKEVKEQAAKLLDDVSKGTLSDDQLHSRAERAQELVDRVNLYSTILDEGLEGLKNVAKLACGAAAAAAMQDFAGMGVAVGV